MTQRMLARALAVAVLVAQTGCAAWFSSRLEADQIRQLRIQEVPGEPQVLILKGVPPLDSMRLPVFDRRREGSVLRVSVTAALPSIASREVRPSRPEFVFPFAIDPEVSTIAYGGRVLWERKSGPPAPTPRDPTPERPCIPALKLDPGKGLLAPRTP